MQIRNRKVVGFITNKEIEIEIEIENKIGEKLLEHEKKVYFTPRPITTPKELHVSSSFSRNLSQKKC
jgi:hypothetical protein